MVDISVKRFYPAATQVAWYDDETDEWSGGIAFGNDIICLDDGSFFNISEYFDTIEDEYPDISFPIIPLDWIDLSEECIGTELIYNYETGEIE